MNGSIMPNTWAMLCHLSGLLGYVTGGLGSIVGPLLVWLLKKDSVPEVALHGKEALDFNITITAAQALLLISGMFLLGSREIVLAMLLMLAVAAVHVTLIVIASVRSYRGRPHRYPLTVRLIR